MKVNETEWSIGDSFICQEGNEILRVTLEQYDSFYLLDDFKAGSYDEYITCIDMIESTDDRGYGKVFKDGYMKYYEWSMLLHLAEIKGSLSEEVKKLADKYYAEELTENELQRLSKELFTPDENTAIVPLDQYAIGYYEDEYRVIDNYKDAKAFLVIDREQMEKFTGKLTQEKWLEQVNEATEYYLKYFNDISNGNVFIYKVERLALYDDEYFETEWERLHDDEWDGEFVIQSNLNDSIDYMGFGDMELLETDEVTEEIYMSQEAKEHFHNKYCEE